MLCIAFFFSYLCRSRGKMLDVDDFGYEACALCYYYTPSDQFAAGAKWTPTGAKGYAVPLLRGPQGDMVGEAEAEAGAGQ